MVEKNYEQNAKIFKALGDPSRLRILDILSCGEKCACEILAFFDFTQPTLSHHMKILIDSGLIRARKDGIWNYYVINISNAERLSEFLKGVISDTEDCLCKEKTCACED